MLTDALNVRDIFYFYTPGKMFLLVPKVLPLSSCNLVLRKDTLACPIYRYFGRDEPTNVGSRTFLVLGLVSVTY